MAQQTQQAQQPLRPDKRFQQDREKEAPIPGQLIIPRHQHHRPDVNQAPPPSPEELFRITEHHTRKFADELKEHLYFIDDTQSTRSIAKNTDDSAILLGLLVSKNEPYESVRIALPVDSLSTRSSSVFSLYNGERSRLTTDITFQSKVKGGLSKEDLEAAEISPDTLLAQDFNEAEYELTVKSSTHVRSKNITNSLKYEQSYQQDINLSQGGYVHISSGSVKFTDPQSGQIKTLKLSDCRLYYPEIRSLNNR